LPRRVLVVEDEAMVALLIEDLVVDAGGQVAVSAATAEHAMVAAHAGGFDLALLDVNLGEGQTSFEVAETLRARGVPFAFLTGYGLQGVRADFRDAPILGKPIDPDELRRFLEQAR
jgi:CheY-like chemotaxis protein